MRKGLHIENGGLVTREELFAYLRNELGPDEKLRIEKLIAEDEFLADAVDGLKGADLANVNASLDNLYRKIDIVTGAKKLFAISPAIRMYAAAVMLILVVGVTFVMIGRLNKEQTNLAYEPKTETEGTIVPDSETVDSDMGGGLKEIANETHQDSFIQPASKDELKTTTEDAIAFNKTSSTETVTVNAAEKMMTQMIPAEDETGIADSSLTTLGYASVVITRDETVSMDEVLLETTRASKQQEVVFSAKEKKNKTLFDKEKSKKSDVADEENAGAPATSGTALSDISVATDTTGPSVDDYKNVPEYDKDASEENKVYTAPEFMPQFPGGEDSLYSYLSNHLHYPTTTMEAEGDVYVRFIINEDGSVSDAQVVKGLGPAYDFEALQVVNGMPHWIPGRQNGEAVKTYFALVVKFSKE